MRLECVRLSGQGRIAPEIASLVEKHVTIVRKALHRFIDGGFDPRPACRISPTGRCHATEVTRTVRQAAFFFPRPS